MCYWPDMKNLHFDEKNKKMKLYELVIRIT